MAKEQIVFSGKQESWSSRNVAVVKHYDRAGKLWQVALTLMPGLGTPTFRAYVSQESGLYAQTHRFLDDMERAIEEARAWLAEHS